MKISAVFLKQSYESGLLFGCPLICAWVRCFLRLSRGIHVRLVIPSDFTWRLVHQIMMRGSLREWPLLIWGESLKLPRYLSHRAAAIVLALSWLERDLMLQLERLTCSFGHIEGEGMGTLLAIRLLHELVVEHHHLLLLIVCLLLWSRWLMGCAEGLIDALLKGRLCLRWLLSLRNRRPCLRFCLLFFLVYEVALET